MSFTQRFLQISTFACLTIPALADIVINEVNYNGEPNTALNEFVELHNTGAEAVDLTGWILDDAVGFVFPDGTFVEAGGYVVIAQNPASIAGSLGPYTGTLSGESDQVVVRDASGIKIDEVNYGSEFPWPIGADGSGASMELINPSLDNDLAGSWRSSLVPGKQTELTLLNRSSSGWKWRTGESEASDPIGAWRESGFVEDESWMDAGLPIGFGGVTDMTFTTTIEGMQSNYTSVFLRGTFQVGAGEIPQRLEVRHAADDGLLIWINGHEVTRRQMNDGEISVSEAAAGSRDEGVWMADLHEDASSFVVEGINTIAVQLFNSSIGGSDLGVDVEVVRLASRDDIPPAPTPGAKNSVYSTTAPPAIRQVKHVPEQPAAGADAVVSAKVTDPDGVASVTLEYQIVLPGAYVPPYLAKSNSVLLRDPEGPNDPNPAYFGAENWTAVAMLDNGNGGDATADDDVYSVTLPGQINRALVRYRIVVADTGGASVRVPYDDDASLNFAYFVYDGVPAYVADKRSVLEVPHTYPAEVMSSVPVYHLLTNDDDFAQCVAYSGGQIPSSNYEARKAYNWRATFVYNGKVYDNVGYRLRQRNARYAGSGKRSFKFRFNDGNYIQLHDNEGKPYPTKWRSIAAHKMLGSRGNFSWGMEQAANAILWDMVGVPASSAHWFHFRVVKSAEERPETENGQYEGDFYGLELAMEEFDKRFLDARGLEPGNVYKLVTGLANRGKDLQRYQAPNAVDDASDFTTIINQLRPARDDQWLRDHVNYDEWNWYHTVVDAVRHYDVSNGDTPNNQEHLKNRAYYFEPAEGLELGRLWLMPWDSDTSWGPNWNGGVDWPKNAIWNTNTGFTRPEFERDYKNTVREFRDLIWTEDQISPLLDRLASIIAPLVPADRDRWRSATSTPGTGRESAPELEGVVEDMKEFAFNLDGDRDSWTGGTWGGGAASRENQDTGISGREGRHKFLDWLADDLEIPETPTITYVGVDGFPQDGLSFSSSAFADPEGAQTFGSMEWRVAEIADEADVAEMEFKAEWESGELTEFMPQTEVPAVAVKVGRTYRARVRHCDDTGRWSHWSAPVEFKVGAPSIGGLLEGLVISEIMYHALGATAAEKAINDSWNSDSFDWIELANVGAVELDLADVRFTKGVEFDFVDGTRTSIALGERIVVVADIAAFNARYGFAETPAFVIGQYKRDLANGGEQLKLSFGGGTTVRDLTYGDSDPWPTTADGEGFSLVLVAPDSVPDHTAAASWRAGVAVNGSPGTTEPNGFVGDPNADADGDGEVALLEYAQGGNDADGKRVAPSVVTVDGGTIRFVVPRNAAAGDVTFVFEVSSDLESWTATDFSGWESANRAIYSLPTEGRTHLWGRSRVTLP
ncbi:MAG: lamin tail domain-containing protein [Verrucomicrobiales bacterium]